LPFTLTPPESLIDCAACFAAQSIPRPQTAAAPDIETLRPSLSTSSARANVEPSSAAVKPTTAATSRIFVISVSSSLSGGEAPPLYTGGRTRTAARRTRILRWMQAERDYRPQRRGPLARRDVQRLP